MHSKLCIIWWMLLLLVSCNRGKEPTSCPENGDTIPMRYARNLTMIERDGRVEVIIRNPWDTLQVLHRYELLLSGERKLNQNQIYVPVRRTAVFAGLHCALLQELGCETAVCGVCEPGYINLPFVHKALADGRIKDLGNAMEPNVEGILDLQPEILMATPFETSGGYGVLERMGIPIVECADYMENSPLGRAEWIRFYGRLFGQGERADSLFRAVEERYLALRTMALGTTLRPRLLSEIPQSGKWYVAGGQSTMGVLYADAGADYVFSDIQRAGGFPVSMEQALDRALTADVWIVKHFGSISRDEICQDVPALNRITACLWVCDTSQNLFYEETAFHPERLLANLIDILHPELGIKVEKSYFCPSPENALVRK